jgi:PPOX class probable F420-dependent enzyme
MTDAEISELLSVGRTLALATLGVDGWPHVTAMWYATVNDSIAFMTHRSSQKHRNLRRDNRIVGLVDTGNTYDQLRGVQFRGRAHEVTDPGNRLTLAAAITAKYQQAVPPDLAERIANRVVYSVEIESRASWDHRKLGEPVAGGAPGPQKQSRGPGLETGEQE